MIINDLPPWSEKQTDFLLESTAKFNLAHGSVRAGKTICAIARFMEAVEHCKGNSIWIIGYSQGTIYRNIIQHLFDPTNKQIGFYRHFCTFKPGNNRLIYKNKEIQCIGAGDQGSLGVIQGATIDLCLCDEMTLYPNPVYQMICTRLSTKGAQLFATMNPKDPEHPCKKMIDLAKEKPDIYYEKHFTIDDNPYLEESYKEMLKDTLTGFFYRRHYLGEWCLAEGAIFDFFERRYHVVKRPPRQAEFYLAAVDYGTANPFACLILGYNSGNATQTGAMLWVEKEYYWDPKKMKRQKTNSEFARDLENFWDNYPLRTIYLDPSAEAFQVELKRIGKHIVQADNDVLNGIQVMTNLMKEGSLCVMESCPNLIREIEGYCWDSRASEKGDDEPIKRNDHAVDALRYCCKSFLKGRTSLRLPDTTKKDFGKTLGSVSDYRSARFSTSQREF